MYKAFQDSYFDLSSKETLDILDVLPFKLIIVGERNNYSDFLFVNRGAMDLVGADSKDAYYENFNSLSPMMQEDGSLTKSKYIEACALAAKVGISYNSTGVFDDDKAVITVRNAFVRIQTDKGMAIAVFLRDNIVPGGDDTSDSERGTVSSLSKLNRDIRTELSNILGVADILLRKNFPIEAKNEIQVIRQAGRRVGSLLDHEFGSPSATRNPGFLRDHPGFSAPSAKALVVDDVNTNLIVTKALLRPFGLAVDTASSGEEALRMLDADSYDIVFMDCMMPGVSGIEATERIRESEEKTSSRTPVIALTANVTSGVNEILSESGFDGFLAKPTDVVMLEKVLEEFLPTDKIEAFNSVGLYE